MLENFIVVVTGGAQGIGKGIARGYCNQGATVIITDIDEEKGIATTKELNASEKGTCVFIHCDVRVSEQISETVKTIDERYGKIDVLINNAGVSRFTPITQLKLEEWEDVIKTNLTGPLLFAKEAAFIMKKQEKGSIVNIASTRAIMSEPSSEAYAASKGGIVALTHALAASLQEDRIQVNAVSPGWIETGDYEGLREVDHKQHFAKRVGKPEDIARACLFLTHPDNDFITGENLVVDGGMTRKMIYEH
ncbi:SDR family NAD(P)-dependent oxidoreductase [Bacillus alkalicellulosilyticus]|uniref:SDR family NAD(P)-dependent oxidoreductase n=1 Tax=Alkalihalobacterium alkalicellulosilyticum TaxID=1912214 RepID=UPI000995FE2D|nr:SDR family oxidoreductase [Bacillus alkalicellulosilyticus]